MHEEEIKKIAEAVVNILKKQDDSLKTSSKKGTIPIRKQSYFKMLGDNVSIGTAGKVFRNPLVHKPGMEADSPVPGTISRSEMQIEENTCSSSCQSCNPLTYMSPQHVKNTGADRVSFCNPVDNCQSIAEMIDHTLLKANATQEEIGKLCEEAKKYKFASVCVNPAYVSLAKNLVKGSSVKVCTVVGFPLGSSTPTVKAIEARDAIAAGADEIDMVINIGALKSGNDALVLDDIKAVREATRGKILKVIIETAYLTKEEKIRACVLAKQAGADFVKTSTGFGPGGATVEDVLLIREVVGPEMGVKASGGIRDCKTAKSMIKAGATRLGTSASVAIVSGKPTEKSQY